MKNNFAEINIIPLVDIMLVLITIVLVTANFMVRGIIPINLPDANAENPSIDKTIVLDMTADGTIYLDGTVKTLESLAIALEAKNKRTPVLINADQAATIQPFVSTVEVLKDNGFTKVSIQTER